MPTSPTLSSPITAAPPTDPETPRAAGERGADGAAATVRLDLLVVGAGFAGLYMLHKARTMGLSARVLEAADGVGGTWYWNRYPGARCDVDSVEYSFSFDEALQQEWRWSERYAAQPELLRYANHVADRFDLRRDIRLGTRVVSACFDDASGRWTVRTGQGEVFDAQYLAMATGPLSSAMLPDLPGIGDFAGRLLHTGRWPHEPIDFAGERVGVIGTGSSGVQLVPELARQARELVVFQRTPVYTVPARNGPLDAEREARIKADYRGFRERNRRMPTAYGSELALAAESAFDVSDAERERIYRERWAQGGFTFARAFHDLATDPRANDTAAQFIRDRIAETVRDPDTARRLMPSHPVLCKRLCIDSGYYETFNRPNVRLVDLADGPIERITAGGVRAGGVEHALDTLVFATGFDAMTGALLRIDIRGRGGVALKDAWRDGPGTYLGLAVAGFPNLFTLVGPGSPSALTNVIMQIEQHVDWVGDCIGWMRANGRRTIEATPAAQAAWVAHVARVAGQTVFTGCNSWYLGANVPGKPRVMMALPGFPQYVSRCDAVARAGYEGFALD